MQPWRCVMPLLGTLAVATIVTVSLPTTAQVAPKDKIAVTVQVQTKAPETKDASEQRRLRQAVIGVAAGLAGAVGLYYLIKQISK